METLTGTARDALTSTCDDVRDGGPGDAVDGVPVGLVARPASTNQVAEVLKVAAAHRREQVPPVEEPGR